MQKDRNSDNIVANTRDLRTIAREAHARGLNRKLKPAQFKLLDPRGTHILSPRFMHDRADGKLVEPHLRMYVHIKLIGKQRAIEQMIDVPWHLVSDYVDDKQRWIEIGIAQGSMEGTNEMKEQMQERYKMLDDIDKVNMVVDGNPQRDEVFDLGDKILENEIAKRAEGNS